MLRPLKTVNKIQGKNYIFALNFRSIFVLGIKILVSTLLNSLESLANVVLFLMFVLLLFGIIGLQLFSGIFENRCRITP